MKMRRETAILAAVCVVLIIVLVVIHKQAGDQRKKDVDTILDFSNQLAGANSSLDELRQVNLVLTNDLEVSHRTMLSFSNQFVETSDLLSNTTTAFQAAEEQVTNLNDRIADLETQNQALDQKAAALSVTITNLTAQITDTQRKLAEFETNNTFLTEELKRQLTERAELEQKFNTLSVVRGQVKKLKEQLYIERRMEWTRRGIGIFGHKETALVMAHPATNSPPGPSHYDLNVEVGSDGSVHIIPDVTNAPAKTNTPPP
jgi:predicted nuclease with TOPRIM domain